MLKMLANANLANLRKNPYPGRGIVVGMDEAGENLVQVYWIMGRSDKSRNRIFGCKGGRLFTELADPSKLKEDEDTSLILYNAMREAGDGGGLSYAVVSNGDQTDAVVKRGMSALIDYIYEPDKSNFTPRITACSFWRRFGAVSGAEMSILRRSPCGACDRHLFQFGELQRGFGHCITTYAGDGNPLPAFQGEPYLVPLVGDASAIAGRFWGALNEENRVSLAVKFIPKSDPSHITIINKYDKVKVAA